MPNEMTVDAVKEATANIAQNIPAIMDAAESVLEKLELGLEIETLTLRPASTVEDGGMRKGGKVTTTVTNSGGNTTVTTSYGGISVTTTCGPTAVGGGAGCVTMGPIKVIRQR